MTTSRERVAVRSLCMLACIVLGTFVFWQPRARTQSMVTRGPYLQIGTPMSVIVRWRTDTASDSRVRYGLSPTSLSLNADNSASTTEHEVVVTGLTAGTQYFYSVGTTSTTLAVGPDFTFYTAPPYGSTQPLRIWVIGDSGTADAGAASVRDAYATFTGTRYTDVWLMLGDNAYSSGTDAEYQAAVFNMYPRFLRQTVLWPTIGNHDTGGSTNPPGSLPYYQMFTLPASAQAGGLASGTEDYYSFDYGNIHFVCLDSMTSDRSAGSPMLTWLQNDLSLTQQNWIIAYWHHPPYSKGSHDSDRERELIEMRENANPVLESFGVDLVLTGHSHSYERSFLLNGHYGTSTTLTDSMKIDGGSGREDSPDGAYDKTSAIKAPNQGAVYAVAGSSGHTSGGTLNHPAMFISLDRLGSMVLDVSGNRLDAKFLRETGAIDDHFTIFKGCAGSGNVPPSVSMTSPTDGATFPSGANITVSAAATDCDGSVTRVEFFAGATALGDDVMAPYGVTWTNVQPGSYSLTARASDNAGATSTSVPVSITVTAPGSAPAAPTNLTAAAGKRRVNLQWTQSTSANIAQNRIYRSGTSGGPYTLAATINAAISYSDRGLARNTTYFYVVTAVNGGGVESPYSSEASATAR